MCICLCLGPETGNLFGVALGSANQKSDIGLKVTCKVLSCVGVGLIKKTLSWQQILCIPCSGNLEINP